MAEQDQIPINDIKRNQFASAMIPADQASTFVPLNIDLFRGLLAQWVIVGHLAPTLLPVALVPGRVAVWSFFIISGFLNCLSFERRTAKHGGIPQAMRGYWTSRLVRIYPMLILSWLVVSQVSGKYWNNDLGILAPYQYQIFGPYANGVLWTLAIELQLYALTPFLYWGVRATRGLPTLVLLIAAYVMIMQIPQFHVKIFADPRCIDDRTTIGNLGFYLFGMFLAIKNGSTMMADRNFQRVGWGLLFLYTAYFLYQYNYVSAGVQFVIGQRIAILSSLLVIVARKPFITKATGLIQFLGFYTFEIYILHGLFAYLHHELSDTSPLSTILYFWIYPIFAVAILHLLNRSINRLKQGRKSLS